jgi:hypothetical protein
MEQAGEHRDPAKPLSAWDEARQYGIDMSALDANLRKTVLERIRNHDRTMMMATALRRAMADRYGQLRDSSGTPD